MSCSFKKVRLTFIEKSEKEKELIWGGSGRRVFQPEGKAREQSPQGKRESGMLK